MQPLNVHQNTHTANTTHTHGEPQAQNHLLTLQVTMKIGILHRQQQVGEKRAKRRQKRHNSDNVCRRKNKTIGQDTD